jgi:hypothetical protein
VTPGPLPDSFFDFARTTAAPTTAAPLSFGDGHLQFLGYDLLDDPDDGVTVRFYWRTTAPLPADLRLWSLIYDDWGNLLSDPTQVPQIATVWYPPAAWQPGETIITETLPQLLPDTFHLGLAAGPVGSLTNPDNLWPVRRLHPDESQESEAHPWLQLATFQRQGPFLLTLPVASTRQPLTPLQANFRGEISLTGYHLATTTPLPGTDLPILLRWQTAKSLPTDLTIFIHLLAPDGSLVAQSDASPAWLLPRPTRRWPRHQPILDRHSLTLPPNLPAGDYTLQVGLYDAQTIERLPLLDGSDVITLTQIEIE